MASAESDEPADPLLSAKIIIAGGFEAGKKTLVGAVSEIPPVRLQTHMTGSTVAMSFGRVSVDENLILYLFGTPGQDRFWFLWDDLGRDALGALVLVDTRRLDDSFGAVNYFEGDSTVPFIVAVNTFDGQLWHDLDEVRQALDLAPEIPLVTVDARDHQSVRDALLALLDHTIRVREARCDGS